MWSYKKSFGEAWDMLLNILHLHAVCIFIGFHLTHLVKVLEFVTEEIPITVSRRAPDKEARPILT